MFEKFEYPKVFRDSLYGNIQVEYKVIYDLINTREMQRLRRIRQLSGVSFIFHTAEHSRFPHSLGAYELARRTISTNKKISSYLSEYEQVLLMTCALLHDLGHGPFSHTFEHVFDIPHETMTIKIVEANTEVNAVLKKHNKQLITDIGLVLNYKYPNHVVTSLISSQIDVDRMDYLSRDSYATGAKYGLIDFERIIRIMDVSNDKLVFRAKGSYTIESYLMSRYHMYWQVYFHPTARSYEVILESICQRLKDLHKDNYPIEADVTLLFDTLENHDINSYIELDDVYITGIIKQLTRSKDSILSDLCKKFVNRRLFKSLEVEHNEVTAKEIKAKYDKNPLLKKYYFKEDTVKQSAYITTAKTDINETKILLENGETTTLSNYSNVVNGLIECSSKQETTIFYGDIDE